MDPINALNKMLFIKPEIKDSDAFRTIYQVIESRGFICKEYKVETDDDYVLTLYRIINPLADLSSSKPILLQHGFTSNSIHWLIASPDGHLESTDLDSEDSLDGIEKTSNNLGFALSKSGRFDVWLGNFRGNRYSLEHKTKNINDTQFWDFSFDEFIEYDLPSTVDFILRETNKESIGYIGHSQGTIAMFGLLSSRPEYNEKISPFIALAPIARLTNMKTPVKHLLPFVSVLVNNMSGPGLSTEMLRPLISGHIFEGVLQRIFHNFLFLLGGFNWDQVDESRLNVYHSHPFADFSFKNIAHFLQIYFSDRLLKFDYGRDLNLLRYHQETPPEYELKKITCKQICLFYGTNDWFTSQQDLDFIRQSLTVPIYEDYRVPNDNWNHLDFLYGKDSGIYVNQKIITILTEITDRQTH